MNNCELIDIGIILNYQCNELRFEDAKKFEVKGNSTKWGRGGALNSSSDEV